MELQIYNPTEEGFIKNIEWNHEDIKKEISEKVSYYKDLVYTEDQIKDAKADRAELNKFVKALEDKRKEVKKLCLAPYESFEKKMKEIVAVVNEPIALIDQQVKGYEEKQKQEKREAIQTEFDSMGFPEFVTLDSIFDSKWLNASTTMKKIQETMNVKKVSIEYDIETLQKLPEFSFEAVEMYKTTLDVHSAIAEASRMSEIAKKKAEAQEQVQETIESPVEEVPQAEPEQTEAEEEKTWKYFNICLTESDHAALCEFLNNRNIEYKQI